MNTSISTVRIAVVACMVGLAAGCGSGAPAPGDSAKPAAAARARAGRDGSATPAAQAASSAPARRDPCGLLTKAEVEDVFGSAVGTPKSRSNLCHFPPQGDSLRSISYAVVWTGGTAAMKRAGGGERLLSSLGDKDVRDAMKKMSAGDDLAGLGDEASFNLVKLHVRKGDAYISFDTRLCSRKHAIEIARKAVARL